MKTICAFVRQNMSYYKRDTAACLAAVIFVAALLSGTGSLLYSSRMGNLENNRLIYGDWNYYTLKTGPLMQELRFSARRIQRAIREQRPVESIPFILIP